MKSKLTLMISTVLLLCAETALAQFPIHLGGFSLGEDIALHEEQIQMATCMQIASTPYLKEGRVRVPSCFQSGRILYGLCDRPNKILRIKLEFQDSSKAFFNTLLEKYSKAFGSPDEYKGDAFQTMIAWKWSFRNEDNERISLILLHNKMIEDEKKGNFVKMTLTSQMDKERACYNQRHSDMVVPDLETDDTLAPEQMWKLAVPY